MPPTSEGREVDAIHPTSEYRRGGFYTKEMQMRLRAMRDLRREVKELPPGRPALGGRSALGEKAGRGAVTEVARD